MTALLSHFSAVLAFVISSFTTVINEVTSNDVLLLFVAIGVAGMLLYWVKSLIHA